VNPPVRPTHVVLVGMMGAGKTTTGLALAARLGWPLRDCDADLEDRTGSSGADLAASEGIARLHELEAEILDEALAMPAPLVITAAGSVVSSERARRQLARRATIVWLDAPVELLIDRMASGPHRRTLEGDAAATLLAERRADLESLADLRLDARLPTDQLVDRIVTALLVDGEPAP
jgi:shikimate kinase